MTQRDIELRLCKKDFMFFVAYCFWNIYHTQFVFYEFHKEVANILLNVKNEKRSIINAPPRIGKTELVKHFIAWQFLLNPSASIIYCSYDQSLVSRKNREILDLLIWLSKHFDLPELMPRQNAKGKTEWVNKANGTILAKGTNNPVTGAGCSTLLVLDDPNKPSDRTSSVILDKRNQIFKSTIRNRINNPDVPIVVIQQRVAADDLSGYLLKDTKEKWVLHKFAAIKEDGTALCPERLPVEEVEKYRNDPFTYNAQYLQVPLDAIGKMFTRESLRLAMYRPNKEQMRIVISVDASAKDNIESDCNAVSVIGYCDRSFYILECQNFRADVLSVCQCVREMRQRWGQVPVLVEAKANGTAVIQILRRETTGIVEISPCKDKVERAMEVKHLFDGGNVFFAIRGLEWATVLAQFLAFPHTDHDDIVDSVVHGLKWLNNLAGIQQKPADESRKLEQSRRRVVYNERRYYGNSGYCP